ncbi:M23 family metallopeptidase [Nocardia arizonensis]|uniref:M23 family metallopeptidase n=1 Tax=Nocardia arizonensis TaxID=1141647 RepID=UPI0006CFFD57|nr:M23 family metallopeptidase [Nocardia arizonensis]
MRYDDDWAADSWARSDRHEEPRPQQSFSYEPRAPRRSRRRGAHRTPPPPHSLRGRVVAFALAAGAFTAAGQQMWRPSDQSAQTVEFEALGQASAVAAPAPQLPSDSTEILQTVTPPDPTRFADLLDSGARYAEEIAAEQAAKMRPLFTKFTSGTFTSGYGARWGVLHPGVDIAAPIGTPIYAVEDGTVVDAGPASGFGMWVRLRGDDGTVTVYGHINTALVSVGDHVTAGDEIATVGNRGESTGPHCHFEVWLNGTDRIDPLPWLATRGISLGPERD